jgi:ribosomal protein L37AE/L43A
MNAEICLVCDFCGKAGLIISRAGIIYCQWCRKSYGESIYDWKQPDFIKIDEVKT